MNSTLFARLVAQVEDAGPGAMRVLSPLGLKPSQYVKMVADWNAHLEGNPSLQAEYARALSTARREVPRVPVVAADLVEGSLEGPVVAVPSYLLPDPPRAPGSAGRLPGQSIADLRGTALALDVPRKEALPFSAGALTPPWPSSGNHADTSEPKPSAAEAPPALTLEQHASMTMDIAAAPERALEVLSRYRLSPDAKRAVDEYYRAVMADDPGVRDAWNRACQAYHGRR